VAEADMIVIVVSRASREDACIAQHLLHQAKMAVRYQAGGYVAAKARWNPKPPSSLVHDAHGASNMHTTLRWSTGGWHSPASRANLSLSLRRHRWPSVKLSVAALPGQIDL
jgi:hypothetical protein